MLSEWVGLVGGVLGLVAFVWELIRWKWEDMEKKKATVSVSIQTLPNGYFIIKLENRTQGQATKLRVLLDDKPIDQHVAWISGQYTSTKETIGPYGSFGYLMRGNGSMYPRHATIWWDDEFKRNQMTIQDF